MKYVSRSLLFVNVSVCVLSHVFKSNCMLKQNPNPTIVNMCLLYIYIVYLIYIYTFVFTFVHTVYLYKCKHLNIHCMKHSHRYWKSYPLTLLFHPCFARKFKAGTDPRSSGTSFSNHSGRSETKGSVAFSKPRMVRHWDDSLEYNIDMHIMEKTSLGLEGFLYGACTSRTTKSKRDIIDLHTDGTILGLNC